MTFVLLTLAVFLFILIGTTLLIQLAISLPGWRQRRDSERRNHVLRTTSTARSRGR